MLKPIRPKRVSDQVFEQLRDLIFKGRFKPGEQLTTEREMAEALGVSRPTVREAIHKLMALGLVENRQGQGTFVKQAADSSRSNPLAAFIKGQDASLTDLLEVRLGLECNAVALAARRATDEDIRELEQCLAGMTRAIKEGNLGHEEDITFHMAIAYATRNTVHIHIMKSLYDLLFYGIKENLQHLYTEPLNLDRILHQHAQIFDAIRRHDPDAGFLAMKEHITYVLDFFKRASINSPVQIAQS